MTFEVELKIKVLEEEKSILNKFLESKVFLGNFFQKDVYLDTIKPSFAENDTALRVRMEQLLGTEHNSKKIELTYKGKKERADSKTRREYNLQLVENTEFETIENFFKELGFLNAITISKNRKNYQIDEKTILSLDENELGVFLEIEKIIEDKNLLLETEDELLKTLKTFLPSVTKERKIVKSYLELMLEANKVKRKF